MAGTPWSSRPHRATPPGLTPGRRSAGCRLLPTKAREVFGEGKTEREADPAFNFSGHVREMNCCFSEYGALCKFARHPCAGSALPSARSSWVACATDTSTDCLCQCAHQCTFHLFSSLKTKIQGHYSGTFLPTGISLACC